MNCQELLQGDYYKMSNVIHQQKQCQVIIKKPKVKIFNWYAMVMGAMRIAKIQKRTDPFTMQSLVIYLYTETIKKYARYWTNDLQQFKTIKDSKDTKHKVLYDPTPITSKDSSGKDITPEELVDRALNEYYYIISIIKHEPRQD